MKAYVLIQLYNDDEYCQTYEIFCGLYRNYKDAEDEIKRLHIESDKKYEETTEINQNDNIYFGLWCEPHAYEIRKIIY